MRERMCLVQPVFFLLLLCFASVSWGQTSSCVTCHTDGAILKSLHKPTVIEGGEGEG